MQRALLFAVAASAIAAGAAQAATFSIGANCLSNCAAAGLAEGGAITGRLELDDSGFTPGGFIENATLQGFSLNFGGATVSNANVFGANIFGQWGATRRELTNLSMVAGTTLTPTTGNAFALLDDVLTVSNSGFCGNLACGEVGFAAAATSGPVSIAAVPLPPGLLLAASALAGFGLVARRRGAAQTPMKVS